MIGSPPLKKTEKARNVILFKFRENSRMRNNDSAMTGDVSCTCFEKSYVKRVCSCLLTPLRGPERRKTALVHLVLPPLSAALAAGGEEGP